MINHRIRDLEGGSTVSLTPRTILLLAAIICFLLAAFSVAIGSIGLVPLGLAALAAAALLGDGGGFSLRR